jgi:uncharacterized membrane protein YcjF (UPF0283 family)
MARLGIIVMDLCRPIPFQENDVPSVASLVSNVVRRRADSSRIDARSPSPPREP